MRLLFNRVAPACIASLCTFDAWRHTLDVQSWLFSPNVNANFSRPYRTWHTANPFLPERMEFERAALGERFCGRRAGVELPVEEPERPRENVWRIYAGGWSRLAEQLRERLLASATGDAARGPGAL